VIPINPEAIGDPNQTPVVYLGEENGKALGIRQRTEINEEALTAAHVAVEDVLIEFRDGGIGVLGCANGFVVNYRDGSPSPVMRLGTREGLRIAIKAYLAHLSTDRPRTAGGLTNE